MKIFSVCPQCLFESNVPAFVPVMLDYNNDDIPEITCSSGHKTFYLVQNFKFELLLETAATALIEGFNYEACAGFSAALERFYEFAIEVICEARNISPEKYSRMFGEMARQSERQLGAFMALYLMEFYEVYIQNKEIAPFRNGVIHKGVLPSKERAYKFSSQVYSIIYLVFEKINTRFNKQIHNIAMRRVREQAQNVPANVRSLTPSGPMFFNICDMQKPADFEKALEKFRSGRDAMSLMASGAVKFDLPPNIFQPPQKNK